MLLLYFTLKEQHYQINTSEPTALIIFKCF